MDYHAEIGHCCSNGTNMYGDPPNKSGPRVHAAFQGHLGGTFDRVPATFYSKYGPQISYRVRDVNGDIRRTNAIFVPVRHWVLNATRL